MGSLLVTVALLITYTIFTRQRLKKKKIKVSPLSYICFYLFGLYICTVMEITGPGNILDIPHNICLKFIWIPFNDIIFGYSLKFALFEFIANIIMFIPLGIFLPLLWQKYNKFKNTVLTGFTFSLMIELFQLLNYRYTDLNDLATNTLGTILGYLLYTKLLKRKIKKLKIINLKNLSDNLKNTGVSFITIIFVLYFFLVPFLDKVLIKLSLYFVIFPTIK